jgi:soluble lytic murein transglycosylase
MNRLKKTAIVSIPLTVLLCFTYGQMTRITGPASEEAKKQRTVQKIIQHIGKENVSMEDGELHDMAHVLYEESKQHGIDYRLVLAVMKVESNFKHDAVSHRGARGLLQLRPVFAKFIARDAGIKWRGAKTLDEPGNNIMIGIRFLSNLIGDFESLPLALHAYHIGPTRLRAILSEKHTPDARFLNLVLSEYKRNTSLLPDP